MGGGGEQEGVFGHSSQNSLKHFLTTIQHLLDNATNDDEIAPDVAAVGCDEDFAIPDVAAVGSDDDFAAPDVATVGGDDDFAAPMLPLSALMTMAPQMKLGNFDKECLRNVNAKVFTNQMWMNGLRTKTNPKTSPEQSGFTLHKLADMRRAGVGKPRPLLDQEKLDLFRGDASRKGHDSIIVAKKFDRLVADLERKMRAALRRLKEMLTGLD
ncbi:hypothetical protein DPMN_010918 [Dreissena polymorpha]|uniref:Uncharacterized protein n=1 Tax=Dreissena polymorpha TaxID=45954 RepID=A0A9D4S1D2_DREPO|nr:hypothetical protein DPMN_010918 [Dreissena polymorpha]